MAKPLPSTLALWTRLMSASAEILAAVEAALKAKGLPPLGWYDALLEIEKAGADGVRPFELKERLLLPQSGMSRLLDRLAAASYVIRLDCPEDGRGYVVAITAEGRAVRRRMWPVYAETLVARVETRLSPEEADAVTRALDRLRGRP